MSMGKRERKQLRKELVRKKERQGTLLGRGALICALVSVVGLAAAVVLSQTGHVAFATWVAGLTGLVIWAMVGFFGARGILLRRNKRGMGALGWAGLVSATVAGLQLIATPILLLAGLDEATAMVGVLVVVPVVCTVGFLVAEWTKDVPGEARFVDTTSMMINK